ncbi:MAG: energy transducer TonB [Pseudomonadales bacterium]|nr:energy transducer TonB [Pseudomonadales bacterium]
MMIGLVFASLATASVDLQATADDAATETPVVEVYSAPRPISVSHPIYPSKLVHRQAEGWVHLHFMVDSSGQPYEIAVTESTGIEEFDRAAVEATAKSRFAPAQRAGKPIDAGLSHKIVFYLSDPSTSAKRSFIRGYKRLMAAIQQGDRALADQMVTNLVVENLYEDAYAGLAAYAYARQWGSRTDQIAGLRRAMAEEDLPRYLPRKQHAAALRNLLSLELETNDFAAAYLTLQRIQKGHVSEAERPEFQRIAERIEAIQSDDTSFVHEGEFGPTSSWFLWLLKNRFRIIVDAGAIAELKLRCDRRYVMFRYDPELEYKVEDKDGLCNLELIGDPGTRFRLIQS